MNTCCPPKRVPSAARFFTLCRLTVQPPQSYSIGGQRSSGQLTGKPAGARPDYRGRWCARGGAAASGVQGGEAAASGAQRGGAEKHTSTTAPTSTPPKQSGADGYGPLPRARGHPAGMHGPPSTRPYAQVAALPGTTGCTVPSSAPPGS
ncbi:UNVERIFIED_CONTAM: hypothetical protein FKN15_040611 [Acipenser sinensis]